MFQSACEFVEFFDADLNLAMRLIYPDQDHPFAGWLCYLRDSDNQWVSLRKATEKDILEIRRATKEVWDRKKERDLRHAEQIATSKCGNCHGHGTLCRRCGAAPWEDREDGTGCNGHRAHEFLACPECGGKGGSGSRGL